MDSYGWLHLIDLVVSLRCRRNERRKLAENDIIEMGRKGNGSTETRKSISFS